MKPPFFLWKSGTLDAFDSIEEMCDLYPAAALAEGDFIACDSEGRVLLAGRGSDGAAVLACDPRQPPTPDALRTILHGYLERDGRSAEDLDSLSLPELVALAYPPPDPRLDDMKFKAHFYVGILTIVALGGIIYGICAWLNQ